MLPGKFNSLMNCVRCKGWLGTISGEANLRFIDLLCPFDRTQRPVCGGKSVKSPEIHLDSAALVHPGDFNAMKSCIGCKEGLGAMSSKVNVRFMALLSPFDRTRRPVCAGKVGQVTLNATSI
jgi:hypothetical protein